MADYTLTPDERFEARGYRFLSQRQCRQCGDWKDLGEFHKSFHRLKDGTRVDTRRHVCKQCQKETLFLVLKQHWFDKIDSGRKWYEFRDATTFWRKRLEGRTYRRVVFQCGYQKGAPRLIRECSGIQRRTLKGYEFYAIRIRK